MHLPARPFRSSFAALTAATTLALTAPSFPASAAARLDLNDVSWLFAPPRNVPDFDNLISLDPKSGGAALWSETAFRAFVTIAGSPASTVGGGADAHRIKLEARGGVSLTNIADWHIAAFRVDPGSNGLGDDNVREFGRSPQIRLILQPVTRDGTTVTVHDFAAHVIFNFASGVEAPAATGCLQRPKPNDAKLKAIIADLVSLKAKLAAGRIGGVRVSTAGPLDVHPGFRNPRVAKPLRDEVKAFLERHLARLEPAGMAVTGLPNGFEPWIFLAMAPIGPNFDSADKLPEPLRPFFPLGYIPVSGPALANGASAAQSISFLSGRGVVGPVAKTNNLNPITCRFNRPIRRSLT